MTLKQLINSEALSPKLNLNHSCHLWLLDLTQLTDDAITRHQWVLSNAELLRAKTFKQRQLQFITMRTFVRLSLARYTLTDPHTLALATEPNGKPYLTGAPLPIVFNLSHSQNMAVLAVGLHYSIGVDIETTSRKRIQHGIAERYFHPTEVIKLKEYTGEEQHKYFYQLWTLKEAFFKATGEGISGGLDKAAFDLGSDGIQGANIQVELAPELETKAQDWQFYQTFVNENYCIALAKNSNQPLNIHWFNGLELFF